MHTCVEGLVLDGFDQKNDVQLVACQWLSKLF